MRLSKRKFPFIANIKQIFMGPLQIFFGTVSQIISIGPKNISTKFESCILKCTILPFLKAYRPYYKGLTLPPSPVLLYEL